MTNPTLPELLKLRAAAKAEFDRLTDLRDRAVVYAYTKKGLGVSEIARRFEMKHSNVSALIKKNNTTA